MQVRKAQKNYLQNINTMNSEHKNEEVSLLLLLLLQVLLCGHYSGEAFNIKKF